MPPTAPRRRREPQEPPRTAWGRLLDFLELSSPEAQKGLALVLVVLVVGFGPLLLLAVLDVSGTARRLLVALGPVSICVGLAALVLGVGYRYGEQLRWSRRQTWALTALCLGMGLLGGLGLWFSEG